jgi:phospholipid transport system substrate-binding protein
VASRLRSVARGAALLLAVALLPALPARATPSEDAAKALISETVQQVIAILKREGTTREEDDAEIQRIVYARFDFDTITKLVLAKNWKRLSEAQRADFVVEFKRHLTLSYGNSLHNYKDEKVTVETARTASNGDVTVQTKIRGASAAPVIVDYRLRKNSENFRVIDVIIEGVSLVSNFKSQTQEILSSSGPDQLIQKLREKNAEREAKKS